MPVVNIVSAFTLTRDDGTTKRYEVGAHDMPPVDAAHWYVQAHSDNPPPYEPQSGTPEFAMAQAAAMARRRLIDAAIVQQAEDARVGVLREANESHVREAHEEEARLAHEEAVEVQQRAEQAASARAARRPVFTPPTESNADPATEANA